MTHQSASRAAETTLTDNVVRATSVSAVIAASCGTGSGIGDHFLTVVGVVGRCGDREDTLCVDHQREQNIPQDISYRQGVIGK